MLSDRAAWQLVSRGLELKFAGLILFAGLPALAAVLWLENSDPRWLVAGVAAAAAPDFAGRCLCLAAPLSNRLSIALSVGLQLFAFTAVVGFGYAGEILEVCVGVAVAGCLQLAAAALFIQFLRAAGVALGRPEVSDRADQLNWRLVQSLLAASGLGLAVFVAAAVVFVVGIVTCGIGFYVLPPVAAIALLPLVLLTGGVVVAMYWAYGSTMLRLRVAIRSPRPRRVVAPDWDAGSAAASDRDLGSDSDW